jgi:hypothetical protein
MSGYDLVKFAAPDQPARLCVCASGAPRRIPDPPQRPPVPPFTRECCPILLPCSRQTLAGRLGRIPMQRPRRSRLTHGPRFVSCRQKALHPTPPKVILNVWSIRLTYPTRELNHTQRRSKNKHLTNAVSEYVNRPWWLLHTPCDNLYALFVPESAEQQHAVRWLVQT